MGSRDESLGQCFLCQCFLLEYGTFTVVAGSEVGGWVGSRWVVEWVGGVFVDTGFVGRYFYCWEYSTGTLFPGSEVGRLVRGGWVGGWGLGTYWVGGSRFVRLGYGSLA